MSKEAVRTRIINTGIIPSVRTSSSDEARFAAETVANAGIPIIELTMTVPNCVEVIAELSRHMPEIVFGAGTVFDVKTARRCAEAGARFVTSPGLDVKLVEFVLAEGLVAIPGALTPTEVTAACESGADFIKIFPCAAVGGASYIHALRGPFPDARFVAAGGVNQQTAGDFIRAGATAIGVGTELIPRRAIQQRDTHWISELARRFLSITQEARTGSPRRSEAPEPL
jgi:2-dehydro-3-deoxyphosphogluconate aldolase/(4S)-4-hydroxy-2-oxoglutarate aldolase